MNDIELYYAGIQDGTIVVGKWVRLLYERIIDGISDGTYIYDDDSAKRVIVFVENFCRHHEGEHGGQLLKLELWQKAFLSVVFGIKGDDGARQFREVFLVVSRKNGKTLFASAIAAYCMYADCEVGARVYFTAPKLDQASLCYDGFCKTVEQEPMLSSISKKRRSDVYVAGTGSTARPIAFNAKKSDGLNVSLAVGDEVASWEGDSGLKFYDVIRSSFGARRQPLLLSISTAGYANDGIYDELMRRSTSFLLGSSQETQLCPFLYMIDDVEKWNDINELRKSNPNMGVSVSEKYFAEEIRIASGSLPKRAEFLTKYCNIKQNSSTAWLDYNVVDNASGEDLRIEDFSHTYCVGGIDLSQTTDLTSCCVVIERNGKLYVFSKFFMPSARLETAIAEDGVPYDIFIKQGWLQLSGENYVEYSDCFAWFKELVERYEILPLKIGYDRYSARVLVNDLEAYGFHCDDVYQGTNLTPVVREFEGIIKDGNIRIGQNNLLKAHLLNVALKTDAEDSKVKPVKVGKRTRIDGAAALLDAMTVRQKWYAEIGEQLKN